MTSAPKSLSVVLDTNILVSALLSAGPPREVVSLALRGILQTFVSPFILHELSTVLVKKLKWKISDAEEHIRWLREKLFLVEPEESITLIQRKKSDNRILECALAAKANYIVTGDHRDLLPLKSFQGIQIIRPVDLLGLISQGKIRS